MAGQRGRPRKESRTETEQQHKVHTKRPPIHRRRDMLAAHVPDNKHAHWAADRDNNLQWMQELGYEFVTSKGMIVADRNIDGEREVGSLVTKTKGSTTLYLMVIDIDLYNADQKAKQDAVDESVRDMEQSATQEGFYGQVKFG